MKYQFPHVWDVVQEMDDDIPGQVVGFHIDGHIDFQDVEEFIANIDWDETGLHEGEDYHWDVTHTYVGQSFVNGDGDELEDAWYFIYSNEPKEGFKAVTWIDRAHIPSRWCMFHPLDEAGISVPAENFADPTVYYVLAEPIPGVRAWGQEIPYIHLCNACLAEYEIRMKAARKQAMAEYYFDQKEKSVA